MVYKTPEVYKTLKLLQAQSFKIKDILYSREHKNDSTVRQDLIEISPNLLRILEDRKLVAEASEGFTLTEWGSSVLNRYEKEMESHGSKNAEIAAVILKGEITYDVKINPRTKPEVKAEVQKPETVRHEEGFEKKKQDIFDFLSKLRDEQKIITTVKEGKEALFINTRIPYYRTIEERKRLDEVAKELGMHITSDNGEYIRGYDFVDRQTTVTLSSKKTGKGFKTYKPLEIRVKLNQPVEPVEKLISSLFKEFSKKE